MLLIFTRSPNIGSKLIRLATWSDWSHVVLVYGQYAIDATWRHGVTRRPISDVLDEASEYALVDIPAYDPEAVVAAAVSQIGKPYDISAVTGIAFRRNWQDDDAWFCSELIAWAFGRSGQSLFRRDSLYRVTPQHLWMLPETKYHGR